MSVKPGKLLTTGEVARLFQVDAKTVSRWAKTGKIPSILTPGGVRRYPEAAVQAIDAQPSYLPSEVAALYRVDPKTVSKWANKGLIPCFRTLGGHRRFPKAEVDALLSGQQANVTVAEDAPPTTVGDIEDGDWIVFDGEKLKVYGAGSPLRGTRVLTLESGHEIELPRTDPIEILRDEPWTPGVGGGQ